MRVRKKREWESLLEDLKLTLQSLSIEYKETKRIKSKGGLCSVKGKNIIILKKDIEADEKAEIIKKELKSFNIENLYIKPEVREFLEE